jgi:hypothetical protein
MSPELVQARTNTFAGLWPHEHKKSWKPKIKQMVEAGWAFDPSPADEDGATCFYCNMSLDGWEPKDSPLEEHRRREPNCLFFVLVDRYKSSRRKGGRGRTSTASKASRLSTQSMQSTFSDAPSLMSLGDADPHLDLEDSIALDTTISSDAGKGRKKTTKGNKKTSRQASVEPAATISVLQDVSVALADDTIYAVPDDDVEEQPKPKRARKAKNTQDSTVMDDSVTESTTKPTRGRKKAKDPSPPVETSLDESQLQSELQEAAEVVTHQQASPPAESARGIKRTSDGAEKHVIAEDTCMEESQVKPKKATKATKGKKSKKPVKEVQEDVKEAALQQPEDKPKRTRSKKTKKVEPEPEPEPQPELQPEEEPEPIIEQNVEVNEPMMEDKNFEIAESDAGLGENVKEDAISQVLDEQDIDQENADPEADVDIHAEHAHIQDQEYNSAGQQNGDVLDAEFDNIENVQVVEEVVEIVEDVVEYDEEEQHAASLAPTPAAEEFEPTPTREVNRASMSSVRRSVVQYPDFEDAAQSYHSTAHSSSSHVSDSENLPPSSTMQASATAQKQNGTSALTSNAAALQPKEIFASPTKTTRVPLAASTPNRSPSRKSPSKLGKLSSTTPWEPVDLEAVFFPDSDENDNVDDHVFDKLLQVGGALTSPEKKMTVEEWIRSRAELGERKLKSECERMVMLFEKEGTRGMMALSGIQTS